MPTGNDEFGHAKTSLSGRTIPASGGSEEPHPTRVGRFVLGRLLGRGGMASVYLASEEGTHRQVAVKLMDPSLKKLPDFVQRFLNEAEATAALRHPNIVETLGHGESDGWYYIATEFVDGGNVATLLHDMKELPPALAGELVCQLLAGLTHAHQKGIVHRDLKPENLLLSAGGILKVGDFGIARSVESTKQLTQTGMLIGTVGYMSPEQARGDPVDQRSDLYAVGIILYELLTGKNPYAAESPATSITRILANAAPPIFAVRPHASIELEGLLDRLLQADVGARFGSAQEAHDALLSFVSERRSTQPTLVAECLRRPQEMRQTLDGQAAEAFVAEARVLAKGNSLEQNHAAVKLKHALAFAPGHAEATAMLATFKGVQFAPTQNPKILELEKYLEKYPDTPQALQQLAQLYKMEGNLLQAAIFQKLYLRQRPTDAYAWSQLFQLTGERQSKPMSRLGPATAQLVAGVKTGGFAAPNFSPPLEGRTGLIAPPAMSPPMPGLPAPLPSAPTTVATVNMPAKSPWPGRVIRLAVVAALGGGAWFGYRQVSTAFDRAAAEQKAAAEALAKQQSLMEQKLLEERSRAELELKAAEAERESTRLLDEGLKELGAERFTHAVAALDALVSKYPKRDAADRALFFRGKALLALDKKTDAIRDFTAFLEKKPLSPDVPEALLRRGQARARNLQLEEAEGDYRTFFEKHTGHELTTQVYLARGELYLLREKYDLARDELARVLASERARPEDKDAAKTLLEKLPKQAE
jgi:tetratricopeptide (TPR) repeat protein